MRLKSACLALTAIFTGSAQTDAMPHNEAVTVRQLLRIGVVPDWTVPPKRGEVPCPAPFTFSVETSGDQTLVGLAMSGSFRLGRVVSIKGTTIDLVPGGTAAQPRWSIQREGAKLILSGLGPAAIALTACPRD